MCCKFKGLEHIMSESAYKNLAGKIAVVTGGGRGIGREVSLLLAGLGVKVAVVDISLQGEEVVNEIINLGGEGLYIQTNISDEESVYLLVDKCISRFGRVDILINNAIYCPVCSTMDMDIKEWNKVIKVNLTGAFLCTKLLLGGMVERNHGVIINMVSAPSMPYLAAYTCTKQALESLTHSLAGELEEKDVSVIAYGPGMVETPGGVEAFRKLSELYGMSYEEFTKSGINPGYDGLIPAYDSAFILAYIIAHAREYNNQTLIMYEVMEKLLTSYLMDEKVNENKSMNDFNYVKIGELIVKSLGLIKDVEGIIISTDEEFNRLPFFVRPTARGGFKKKCLISIGDLKEMLNNMVFLWKDMSVFLEHEDISSWNKAAAGYMSRYGRIKELIPNIRRYYQEVPEEISKFIKDKDVLDDITRISRERQELWEKLLYALVEVEPYMK